MMFVLLSLLIILLYLQDDVSLQRRISGRQGQLLVERLSILSASVWLHHS